jgi:chromosome segregation ATPase
VSSNKPELATPSSSARRAGLVVLLAGGVLSVAAAFGPIWVVRAGVAVAIIAGVVACVLAWRHATRLQRAREADQAAAMHRQAAAATEQRQQHAEVLETLNERHDALRAKLRELRITHADLLIDLNTLRGDKNALTSEVDRLTSDIAQLRERVAELEEALALEPQDAEVLSLPRRVGRAASEARPEDELFPTVIDLQALALPFVEEVRRDHA